MTSVRLSVLLGICAMPSATAWTYSRNRKRWDLYTTQCVTCQVIKIQQHLSYSNSKPLPCMLANNPLPVVHQWYPETSPILLPWYDVIYGLHVPKERLLWLTHNLCRIISSKTKVHCYLFLILILVEKKHNLY